MNIVEIVRRMEHAGVTVHQREGKLQVRSDTPLTEAQNTFLKERRDELLHYLQVMDDPHLQTMLTLFDAKVQAIHPNKTAPI